MRLLAITALTFATFLTTMLVGHTHKCRGLCPWCVSGGLCRAAWGCCRASSPLLPVPSLLVLKKRGISAVAGLMSWPRQLCAPDPNLAEHDAGSSFACLTVTTVAAAVSGLSGRVELSSWPCFSVATAAAAVGG
jgi:hypothetical protein